MADDPDAGLKTSFYLLMAYAALFGVISSLLAAGFITLYNQGIEFKEFRENRDHPDRIRNCRSDKCSETS